MFGQEQFSIITLSAFNSDVVPRVAVAIKAYYDGSGADVNGTPQRITLAGYAAAPDCWAEFERRWASGLAGDGSRPSCAYLHMVDVNALREEFDRRKGWTTDHTWALQRSLLNNCLGPLGWNREHGGLIGATCTVELDDYRSACETLPQLAKKSPHAICVDHVVSLALKLLPKDKNSPTGRVGSVELFFDQNEPFYKFVFDLWNQPYHKRPAPLRHVAALAQANMRTVSPLQAADFLAWHTNRAVSCSDQWAQVIRVFAAPIYEVHYDYDTLVKHYRHWTAD